MSVARGLAIIVACGVGFGAAGGLLGFALGTGAPGYYRTVFRAGDDPAFNPVQVGLGLGVTQGLIGGLVIGSVAVLAEALSRPTRPEGGPAGLAADRVDSGDARPSRVRRALGVVAVLAAIGGGGVVSFVAGGLVGQEQLYRRGSDTKLARIRPVLRDPEFSGVNAEPTSDGEVFLVGKVGSRRTYEALEERMRFLFGDEAARFLMGGVEVAGDSR